MSQTQQQLVELWQQHEEKITVRLKAAFRNHAIDNRGLLTSTRQTETVVDKIRQLALNYISHNCEISDVTVAATELANQGLSIVTGAAMMRAMGGIQWLETADPALQEIGAQKLLDFQLLFVEKLSSALVLIQQHTQERSHKALQDALHTQIEQQSRLRSEQETYNLTANKILALHARLAGITEEDHLLDQALSGICQALDLADVTLYDLSSLENYWSVRTTTNEQVKPYDIIIANDTLDLLHKALTEDGYVQVETLSGNIQQLTALLPIHNGESVSGAVLFNSNALPQYQVQNLPVLLRTFTQNLASQRYNLQLFTETKQRSLEMEILYGRYIDSIWNPETAVLQATYENNNFQLNREQLAISPSDKTQAIPLTISNRAIGQINLPDDIPLDDGQEVFIHELVREMSNALNNAYLLQTTRATSNQLSLATEVSRAATTILDHDLLSKEVVELIRARFNLYYVGLFLLDEQGETAVLQAGTGEAGRLQIERHHHQRIGGTSMIGTCIANGQAIVEQDITQAKAFKFNPLLPDTRSELAMPLRTRGQIIGALTVQSSQKGAFTGETVAVLQSLADQLAIAIENASLFDQIQSTLAETNLLYQASRQISEAQNPEGVYEALINFARHSQQVDAAYIAIIDEDNPTYLISPAGWSRQHISVTRLPRRPFEFNIQLRQNEIVLITDIHSDSRLNDTTRQLFLQHNIRSSALIPIYLEDTWLGTFLLHRTRSEPITREMLPPYHTLADQAAIILSNQKLFQEIKQANEQLRQLDRLKTQFLANMSHELRTPLNSIIGFSRVILKGIDGPITTEQEEDLSSIHSNGQHLLSLINEILDMAKIEAGKMALAFEMVNIEAAAQTAFSSIRALVKPDVKLIWDVQAGLPTIEADQVRVRQILTNLLSNAAKFTHEGLIRLEMSQEDDNHIHLAVHDTGIGIAPEEFAVLFRAFEQVDNSTTRNVGGTGLGLPITKWLVTMHGGHIWVDSAVGKGTAIHVRLPLKQSTQKQPETTFIESITSL